MSVQLDPLLLDVLACPSADHAPLRVSEGQPSALVCTACGRRYPVVDGIPVLLLDNPVDTAQATAEPEPDPRPGPQR